MTRQAATGTTENVLYMRLTDSEHRFVKNAIRRKKLFLTFSLVGVIVGLCLALYYAWQFAYHPGFSGGLHFVLVLLIFLMARQNLRQYYYAKILEKLVE